jgi:hypothetical protein
MSGDAHARIIDVDGLNGVALRARVRPVSDRQKRLIDRDGLDGICSRVGTGRGLGPAQERAARLGIFVIGTPRALAQGPQVEPVPDPAPLPIRRKGPEDSRPTVMLEANPASPEMDMMPTEIGPWTPPEPAAVGMAPEEPDSASEVVALPPGLAGLVWAEVEHERTELVTDPLAETPATISSAASAASMDAQLNFSLQPSSEEDKPRPRSKASAVLMFGAAVFATGAAGGAAAAAVFLVAALSWVVPAPQGLEPAAPPPRAPAEPAPAAPAAPAEPRAPAVEMTVTDAFSFAEVENASESPDGAFLPLATELGRCQGRVILTGHTCSLGPEEANLAIGLKRAGTVRDHLVRAGFPADRIEIRTEGSRSPIAANDTEEGRRRNRRVTAICNELTTE